MSADQALENNAKPVVEPVTNAGLQPEDYQLIKNFAKAAKDLSFGEMNNVAIVDSKADSTSAVVGNAVRISKDAEEGTTTIATGNDKEGLQLTISPSGETWSVWGPERNAQIHTEQNGDHKVDYIQRPSGDGEIITSDGSGNYTWSRWDAGGNRDWGYAVDGKEGLQRENGMGFYKERNGSTGSFLVSAWSEDGQQRMTAKLEEGVRTLKLWLGNNSANITEWGDGTVKVEQSNGSGWVSKPAGGDLRSYHMWGKGWGDNRDFKGKSIGFKSISWAQSAFSDPNRDPSINSFVNQDILK